MKRVVVTDDYWLMINDSMAASFVFSVKNQFQWNSIACLSFVYSKWITTPVTYFRGCFLHVKWKNHSSSDTLSWMLPFCPVKESQLQWNSLIGVSSVFKGALNSSDKLSWVVGSCSVKNHSSSEIRSLVFHSYSVKEWQLQWPTFMGASFVLSEKNTALVKFVRCCFVERITSQVKHVCWCFS